MNAADILSQIEAQTNLRNFINKEQLKHLREHCQRDMPTTQKELPLETVEAHPDEEPRQSRARRKRGE